MKNNSMLYHFTPLPHRTGVFSTNETLMHTFQYIQPHQGTLLALRAVCRGFGERSRNLPQWADAFPAHPSIESLIEAYQVYLKEQYPKLSSNGMLLRTFPSLKGSCHAVLISVKSRGEALEFASETLKDSVEVVRAAITQNPKSAVFAKRNAVLEILRVDGPDVIFPYLKKKFKQDCDIVLEAVKRNGLCLKHAIAPAKHNPTVVLAAITNTGAAYHYVTNPTLLEDERLGILACKTDKTVLQCLNRSQHLQVLAVDGTLLQYADAALTDDDEVVSVAVGNDGRALQFASARIRKCNYDVMLLATCRAPQAIQYITTFELQVKVLEEIWRRISSVATEECGEDQEQEQENGDVFMPRCKSIERYVSFCSRKVQKDFIPEPIQLFIQHSLERKAQLVKETKEKKSEEVELPPTASDLSTDLDCDKESSHMEHDPSGSGSCA
eukprot:PhF_6_TR33648/c0_g2_i1/m.49208